MNSDFIPDEINRTFKLRCKSFPIFCNFNHINTFNEYYHHINFFYFQLIYLQIEFFNTKYLSLFYNLSIGANSGCVMRNISKFY